MPLNEERIRQLLAGHLQQRLTESEQTELFQAILSDEHLFRRIAGDLHAGFTGSTDPLDAVNRETILSAIFTAGKTAGSPDASPSKQRSLYVLGSRWLRYAAAILVILGLGFVLYYVLHPRMKTTPDLVQAGSKADVAPGGNKAVLTLGNGSRITLDSAANGMIASQGNARISKVNSGLLAYNTSSEKSVGIFYNSLTTPRGGQYQLSLPDGTRVWLNAASSITYPTAFAGNERKVTITGEAYFEVVRNQKMPFLVRVNEMEVEVLGTRFNINAYADEKSVNTTLLEGSVRINDGKQTLVLKPGEQAQVADKMIIRRDIDMDKVMAWKNGWFEFDRMDLAGIMRQVSRWYNVDIVYESKPAAQKFGGRITKDLPLSNILQSLEANGQGVKFRIDGMKLIVQP